MAGRNNRQNPTVSLFHRAGEWITRQIAVILKRMPILVLQLLTLAGLYCVAVHSIEVARGQLRWTYSMVPFIVALCGLPVGAVWILLLWSQPHPWSRARLAQFAAGWYTLMLLFFVSSFTYLPLRVGFAVEQAPLEALAHCVARGHAPQMPLQVGLYTVTKVEKDSRGIVWLWICPHGDATHQCSVFVRCTSAELPPDTVLFPRGLNAKVKLAHRWYCLGYEG